MSQIYLRHGSTYVALKRVPYEREVVLQELLAQHPEMLAGHEDGRLMLAR